MNNILRNVIAVIIGWLVGSVVNMSLISLGHHLLPIEGIDTNNIDELSKAMSSLDLEYFIFPFFAHAIGTLVGSIIAALIAKQNKRMISMIVGVIFLLGGITVSFMIDSPLWFTLLDLIIAYIPMAYLGYKLAIIIRK